MLTIDTGLKGSGSILCWDKAKLCYVPYSAWRAFADTNGSVSDKRRHSLYKAMSRDTLTMVRLLTSDVTKGKL